MPCSKNLQQEWLQCCSAALGYELTENESKVTTKDGDNIIVLLNLLDDTDERLEDSQSNDDWVSNDAWMENATRINDSLNKIIQLIARKKNSYFEPRNDDEASLLESTVLSFVATTANQIEALQQTISSSNRDFIQHCIGIVGYLMATLREEIANPFAKMQKQRMRPALSLWENPLQCRLILNRFDPLDDADEEEQEFRFIPKTPLPSPSYDFLDTYQLGDDSTLSLERPKSILQLQNQRTLPPPATNQSSANVQVLRKVGEKPPPLPPRETFHSSKEQDEEYSNLLQQEALLLTATLQTDLDSVHQVEARMTEITALLTQFSNLVSEQQMEIVTIHETTVESKRNVEKGHDHLVNAAERVQQSRHYMASIITIMALLLLFLNTITR